MTIKSIHNDFSDVTNMNSGMDKYNCIGKLGLSLQRSRSKRGWFRGITTVGSKGKEVISKFLSYGKGGLSFDRTGSM